MKNQSFDERYFCAYLCNSGKINDFATLLDFYKEVSEASLKSKNIGAWQIKLKWFLEAIQNTNNKYSPIINKFNTLSLNNNWINSPYLFNLLEAKNIDLDPKPFKNQENLIQYAQTTGGNLWVLMGLIENKDLSEAQKNILNLCGSAFAILGIIRNYKFNEARGIYSLVYDGQSTNQYHNQMQLKDNIKNLLDVAKIFITKSSQQKKILPKKLKRLLLLNIFTAGYIKNFEKTDYTHTKSLLTNVPKLYYLKLMWAIIRG